MDMEVDAQSDDLNFEDKIEIVTTESLTPVAGHISVAYRGCLISWGGYYYDERVFQEYRPCDSLYIYPFRLLPEGNIWFRIRCKGDVPLSSNSGATAAIYGHCLYMFGGCISQEERGRSRIIPTSSMIKFDLKQGIWTHIQPKFGMLPTPRDKATSWIADERFYVFGGYGTSWHRLDRTVSYLVHPENFHEDENGQSWNNQLLYFDFSDDHWVKVLDGGDRPTPRAATSSAYISSLNKVFLFGGRHDISRLNDLYELDIANNFLWTKIDISAPLLTGRSWNSFTYIPDKKKILLFGGLSSFGDPLDDVWELDLREYFKPNPTISTPSPSWVSVPPIVHKFPARLWHSAVLMGDERCDNNSIGSEENSEAILFYGGMAKSPSDLAPFVGTLLCWRFRPPSLFSSSLRVLANALAFDFGKCGPLKNKVEKCVPIGLRYSAYLLAILYKYKKIKCLADPKQRRGLIKRRRHSYDQNPPPAVVAHQQLQPLVNKENETHDIPTAIVIENQLLKHSLYAELREFCEEKHPLHALFNAFDL